MADRNLLHAGHATQEVAQIGAVQVVAGIQPQTFAQRRLRGGGEGRQHRRAGRRAVGARVAFGVQLDALGAQLAHRRHRLRQRIHEQADAHAQGSGFIDQRSQAGSVLRELPAVVGRGLLDAVGHERHLVHRQALARQLAHEAHQVVEGVALDVVFGLRPLLHQIGQLIDIVRADVALIGARVHGDAVRAGLQRQRRSTQHAGNAQLARVAQQRDLVDVDRQGGATTVRVEPAGEQGVHGERLSVWRPCRSNMTCRVRKVAVPSWCCISPRNSTFSSARLDPQAC